MIRIVNFFLILAILTSCSGSEEDQKIDITNWLKNYDQRKIDFENAFKGYAQLVESNSWQSFIEIDSVINNSLFSSKLVDLNAWTEMNGVYVVVGQIDMNLCIYTFKDNKRQDTLFLDDISYINIEGEVLKANQSFKITNTGIIKKLAEPKVSAAEIQFNARLSKLDETNLPIDTKELSIENGIQTGSWFQSGVGTEWYDLGYFKSDDFIYIIEAENNQEANGNMIKVFNLSSFKENGEEISTQEIKNSDTGLESIINKNHIEQSRNNGKVSLAEIKIFNGKFLGNSPMVQKTDIWVLKNIDYETEELEFENENDQNVKVAIERAPIKMDPQVEEYYVYGSGNEFLLSEILDQEILVKYTEVDGNYSVLNISKDIRPFAESAGIGVLRMDEASDVSIIFYEESDSQRPLMSLEIEPAKGDLYPGFKNDNFAPVNSVFYEYIGTIVFKALEKKDGRVKVVINEKNGETAWAVPNDRLKYLSHEDHIKGEVVMLKNGLNKLYLERDISSKEIEFTEYVRVEKVEGDWAKVSPYECIGGDFETAWIQWRDEYRLLIEVFIGIC